MGKNNFFLLLLLIGFIAGISGNVALCIFLGLVFISGALSDIAKAIESKKL